MINLIPCRFDDPPIPGSLVFDTVYKRHDPCIFLGKSNVEVAESVLVVRWILFSFFFKKIVTMGYSSINCWFVASA